MRGAVGTQAGASHQPARCARGRLCMTTSWLPLPVASASRFCRRRDCEFFLLQRAASGKGREGRLAFRNRRRGRFGWWAGAAGSTRVGGGHRAAQSRRPAPPLAALAQRLPRSRARKSWASRGPPLDRRRAGWIQLSLARSAGLVRFPPDFFGLPGWPREDEHGRARGLGPGARASQGGVLRQAPPNGGREAEGGS